MAVESCSIVAVVILLGMTKELNDAVLIHKFVVMFHGPGYHS